MEQEKILILNLLKELSEGLEIALKIDSVEVVNSIEELDNRSPLYILTDSKSDLPKEDYLDNSRILRFESVDDVNDFLKNQGDVIFNPAFAKSDVGAVMLERFFSRETVVQMESAYEGILEKSFSTKFSNPLTVGYYSDIIAKFAHTEKADITGLRTFLSSAASFFTYLTKDKVSWFPLDVDYGVTGDALIVQIIAPVTKMYKDYVMQSLSSDDSSNPFAGLMEICTKQSHAIDLYYLEKANKLVITGVWLKDQKSIGQSFYPSLLINQLYTFKELKEIRKNSLTSKVKLVQEDIEVNYDLIPGSGIEKFEEDSFKENKNLLSIKKLVDFIKMLREADSDSKPENELALRDISRYLRKYPDQQEIRGLEQSDREAILKCFSNNGAQEELEETITVVKSSIDQEEFLQTVLDNLTEMDEEEAVQILSGGESPDEEPIKVSGSISEEEAAIKISGGEDEIESVTKITGSKEIKEESNKVKGLKKEEEKKVVIKGGEEESPTSIKVKSLGISSNEKEDELINKEHDEIDLGNVREAMRKNNRRGNDEEEVLGDWEIKKKKITEKVTKKLENLKNGTEESDIGSLEDEIMTVFKSEMGPDQAIETVVKSITSDASDKLVAEKLNNVHEAKLKIQKEKGDQVLALRDEQIVRMKKVLDTIKEENGALKARLAGESIEKKALLSDHEGAGFESTVELKTLEVDLQKALKEVDTKEVALTRLKDSQKIALENKEKQIEQLQQRVENILDAKEGDGSTELASEMKKVTNENRLLQSQLDLKDKTIENMNKRMEGAKHDMSARTNVELERVKEQNRVALEAMKAFKVEKAQIDGKLIAAQREARQKETELNIERAKKSTASVDTSAEVREKERELQTQKVENTKLQEQNKALGLRAKQLEQKMKFLSAQVESANKGSRGAGRSTGGVNAAGGREAKLALKLKQVETAREKMAMDTQRLSGQLDTKKKEAVSLTNEINTLNNKVKELEQKLSKIEKKAA